MLAETASDAIIVIDADLEQPPGLIPDLVKQWRAGFKVVAVQHVGCESTVSWFERVTSRFYSRVLDTLGDVHIEPGSANYMLLDRVVVDSVNRIEDQDLFLRGVVRWLGYPVGSVPFGTPLMLLYTGSLSPCTNWYPTDTNRFFATSFSTSRLVSSA